MEKGITIVVCRKGVAPSQLSEIVSEARRIGILVSVFEWEGYKSVGFLRNMMNRFPLAAKERQSSRSLQSIMDTASLGVLRRRLTRGTPAAIHLLGGSYRDALLCGSLRVPLVWEPMRPLQMTKRWGLKRVFLLVRNQRDAETLRKRRLPCSVLQLTEKNERDEISSLLCLYADLIGKKLKRVGPHRKKAA